VNKKLILCRSVVNKERIKRENRNGIEHIVITSYTLPPNIVMNGGLYPEDEVANSFHTLDRTLAPVEHPQIDGQYLPASDPIAINEFYAGAWNENPTKLEDGRIAIDKVINVSEALKTERGKRLLDRIDELETNDKPRAIHTSVGVYIEVDVLDEPKFNASGDSYSWVAKGMVFDHDAILLDSIGAATPEKGVGIGVNSQNVDVEIVTCDRISESRKLPNNLRTNESELSFHEITMKLYDELNLIYEYTYIAEVYNDTFIYENENSLYQSNYTIDNGDIKISDTRLPVKRVVEYKQDISTIKEDNVMRDAIIAELAKMGITANAELSDAELLALYNEKLTANNDGSEDAQMLEKLTQVVNSAIEPLKTELTQVKTELSTNSDKELTQLAEVVVNSGKYAGLDLEDVKSLGAEKVRGMAANCQTAFGINSTFNNQEKDDSLNLSVNVADLPE